jgi:hypothetical protein
MPTIWPKSGSAHAENPVQHKGVEYSVIQLTADAGWKWEFKPADGKSRSGVTPVSRAAAIKIAEYEIDRVLKERK